MAGFGAGAYDNFIGSVDNVTIGVDGTSLTYDFDAYAAPALVVATAAYTEQNPAVVINSNLTIVDEERNLASATVQIDTGRQSGDILAFNSSLASSFGLSGGYSPGSGTLAFSGTASAAQYQALLRTVTFENSSNNDPTASGADRGIVWTLNDGISGGSQSSTVTVSAANDAPVNNLPASPSIGEDVQTAITGLSITDADADPATDDITVTLSVGNGTLNVLTDVANGIEASDITGGAQNSESITIAATLNQINATLAANGLRYRGDLNYNGSDNLHIVTSDNGHTGSGALSDTDDLAITVTAVNDAPSFGRRRHRHRVVGTTRGWRSTVQPDGKIVVAGWPGHRPTSVEL